MNLIERTLRTKSNTHRDDIRRIKSYEPLVGLVTDIVEKHWTTETKYKEGYRRYHLAIMNNLRLEIHLSKFDSLKYDIMDVLEAILDVGFVIDYEYQVKGDHKNWDFIHPTLVWKDIKGKTFPLKLELYVKYDQSEKCKMVETSEIVTPKPYNKSILVCED